MRIVTQFVDIRSHDRLGIAGPATATFVFVRYRKMGLTGYNTDVDPGPLFLRYSMVRALLGHF